MFCERLERESERAFAYFERYRDMAPPRDITKLLSIKLNGKTSAIRTLRKWKSEALKNMERITLIEMFNISESLRKLERLQNNQSEAKADPDIESPEIDLPKV